MWWGTAGEAPRGNDASTASLKSRTENSLLEQARSVFYSLRHRNVRTAIASCEEACTKGPMLIPTFVTVRVHANRERLGTRCIHVRWHGGRCCYGALFLPLPTSRQIFSRETFVYSREGTIYSRAGARNRGRSHHGSYSRLRLRRFFVSFRVH